MAIENKENVSAQYGVNAKWDACVDLTVRRFIYSSIAGTLGGLLLFRSPATRWASIAFGAGIGMGSAYTECSSLFGRSPPKLASTNISENPTQNAQEAE